MVSEKKRRDGNGEIQPGKENDEGDVAEYEQCREQRIKENLERMHKLGILDLSRNLKPRPKPKTKTLRSHKPSPSLSASPRRSSRKIGKGKAPDKAVDKSKAKAGKAAKDRNKPKRPSTAFFVFLEEFRKTFKKENPTVRAVSAVGKAGGEKWRYMSDAEKASYENKAAERKRDYEQLMAAYNQKQDGSDDEEEDDDEDVDEELKMMNEMYAGG